MSPDRADAAQVEPAAPTRFSLTTDAECSTLARIVEVFAMRSVLPARLESLLAPDDHSATPWAGANVDIQVNGLGPGDVDAIARRLSRVIGVRSVQTSG
ncbi:MAG: hypothetical protein FJX19_04180 [Alphaproteobacteria bacterium]|nr:hypothetical protein [Alphaproteobacteria bacterium]